MNSAQGHAFKYFKIESVYMHILYQRYSPPSTVLYDHQYEPANDRYPELADQIRSWSRRTLCIQHHMRVRGTPEV